MDSLLRLKIRLSACCAIASLALIAYSPLKGAENVQNSYAFCGDPLSVNAFNQPLDYRDPSNAFYLQVIENAHFTRDVEMLIRGSTGDSPVNDLAYVLRQMPNHYRALAAMSNYQLKNDFQPVLDGRRKAYSADCYFRRAVNFTPDDPVIHLIYGIYLHKSGNLEGSLAEYLAAKRIGPLSAELHYNLGLLYVDLKDYEAARQEAKSAYELGYPLDGLRNKLDRLGEWNAR